MANQFLSCAILLNRPEGIEAGTLKLVGTNEDIIYNTFRQLLDDKNEYTKMSKASNPYGDGFARQKDC